MGEQSTEPVFMNTVSKRRAVRSRMQAPVSHEMVAVVIPGSTRSTLSSDEEISLAHLRKFLGAYDKYLVVPSGSGMRLEGLLNVEVGRKYFGSASANGRLMMRSDFYRRFVRYRYILVYHLDALVFRDEVPQWCATDLDYIGAPWVPGADMPWVKEPAVGNGGFTLMKVESVLSVLRNRRRVDPMSFWEDEFGDALRRLQRMSLAPRRLVPRWLRHSLAGSVRENVRAIDRAAERADANARRNDLFWSFEAVKYLPTFQVADWRMALRFAFEGSPRACYELNGNRLPFGCHAWTKYNRAFWEPFLAAA